MACLASCEGVRPGDDPKGERNANGPAASRGASRASWICESRRALRATDGPGRSGKPGAGSVCGKVWGRVPGGAVAPTSRERETTRPRRAGLLGWVAGAAVWKPPRPIAVVCVQDGRDMGIKGGREPGGSTGRRRPGLEGCRDGDHRASIQRRTGRETGMSDRTVAEIDTATRLALDGPPRGGTFGLSLALVAALSAAVRSGTPARLASCTGQP